MADISDSGFTTENATAVANAPSAESKPAIENAIAGAVALPEDSENHFVEPKLTTACPPPPGTKPSRITWSYAIPIWLFHVFIPLAFVPYFFSWTGVVLLVVFHCIVHSAGVGAGFHRLLTHRSFKCPLWFEHLLAIIGTFSLQQAPARWVMVHRMHHQNSDHVDDPHTPNVNWFWSHMGWILHRNRTLQSMATYEKYAKDMIQDPLYAKLERNGNWFLLGMTQVPAFFLAGYGVSYWQTGSHADALQFGLSLMLWGAILRVLLTWHVTWGVNSFAHMVGYRNYETDENSQNNWFLAILTNGDGWHNNHHADPRSCAHGFHRWWEVDVTYMCLCLLSKVGLVWDMVPIRVQSTANANPARK